MLICLEAAVFASPQGSADPLERERKERWLKFLGGGCVLRSPEAPLLVHPLVWKVYQPPSMCRAPCQALGMRP